MSRGEYLLRRLALSILVLLGVMMVTFVVSRLIPGDPARLYLGPRASPEKIEEVREQLGLNDPLPEQFLNYVTSLGFQAMIFMGEIPNPVTNQIEKNLSREITFLAPAIKNFKATPRLSPGPISKIFLL